MQAEHYDSGDPVFHDLKGDAAVRAIVARKRRWVEKQDAETQARMCSHGRYVGYSHFLAYRCPGCVEEGLA